MEQNRVIIVGASSGIGAALASRYVAMGWKVGITGRRKSLLDSLKQQWGESVHVSVFDVTEPGGGAHVLALIGEMGGLDLLVYNSGFGEVSRELVADLERRTTQTNVNGFLETVVPVFNYFVQKGKGQIALTSSVASLRGNSWAPAYSASKAFMSTYAEGLRMKARKMKKDIVITDIRPGFVRTEMAKGPGLFWVAPVEKAAAQMVRAIEAKKRVSYITRRWWLVAQVMRFIPYGLYKRIA